MKKWKPRTKKAQKLWDKIIKDHHDDGSIESGKQIWKDMYDKKFMDDDFFNFDSRKILYISDGLYVTKDGIFLDGDDAELLDF